MSGPNSGCRSKISWTGWCSVKIGPLGGFSTICLARGVGAEGSVITCEHNPACAAVAALNLARAGLAERVDIRVGPALDTLVRHLGRPFAELVAIAAVFH